MTVSLSVSQVRQALSQQERPDPSAQGPTSTALLGRWFHDAISFLIVGTGEESPLSRLDDIPANPQVWAQDLANAAYRHVIGPRLTQEQAALHGTVDKLTVLWQAVQEGCQFLAELHGELRVARAEKRLKSVRSLRDCLVSEEPLGCVLRLPEWSDEVRLQGIPDAVLRSPLSGHWCALEFKLGQANPLVDLGQACLYHLILEQTLATSAKDNSLAGSGALAVVSFRPERQERLFTSSELQSVRQTLLGLIGSLAGVTRGIGTTTPEPAAVLRTPRPKTAPQAVEAKPSYEELARRLESAWREHGLEVRLDQPYILGPTFIRYPITLGRGVRAAQIMRYAMDLQVRAKLKYLPIIRVDKGELFIDVQRPDRQTIFFDDVEDQIPAADARLGGSEVPIGVDLSGRLICANLAHTEHTHMLVAGTTGSGKSEWLRLAIAGLLKANTPDTLRLLLIDPKRMAFHALRKSPYLWRPVVYPGEHSAIEILTELVDEMERRYSNANGADTFAQMVAQSDGPLPRIVCICDEYRDLITRDSKERKLIEGLISRLGAKARAAGIHLILATQEASRETVSGVLQTNIPARVSLQVQSAIESRMLLQESGAEHLLNHGDLLFKDVSGIRRLQAPLMSEENRREIFGTGSTAE